MIEVCRDMQHVRNFMLQPEITYYALEYGADAEDEVFESHGRQGWLTYSIEGERIGMINFHLDTGTMGMFHPYILRAYKDFYDAMVKEFFGWFLDNVPEEVVKLNAMIPVKFKGALNAANRAGMAIEGKDRLSYLTSDGACDRMLLGITREEMINE